MNTKILNNTIVDGKKKNVTPPAPSVKEDGSFYNWRMFYLENSKIADSDSIEELIDILVPGYKSILSESERLSVRTNFLNDMAYSLRLLIYSNLSEEELENLEDWEEEKLEPTRLSPTFNWSESAPVWKSKIPLILLASDYGENDNYPPLSIEGDFQNSHNLVYLDPTEEITFLESLSRVGFITFGAPMINA